MRLQRQSPLDFRHFILARDLGHCIPIDPFYLTWKASEYDFSTGFIELAGEINIYMPHYVVQKTIEALNEKSKSINGAMILILALAYKKDVDDVRESPSLKLIEILQAKGAEVDYVDYNDPYIATPPKMRKYKLDNVSIPLTRENLSRYDCVIIATDHSIYDPEFIVDNSRLIIDTRNLIKNSANHSNKVKKA